MRPVRFSPGWATVSAAAGIAVSATDAATNAATIAVRVTDRFFIRVISDSGNGRSGRSLTQQCGEPRLREHGGQHQHGAEVEERRQLLVLAEP